MKRNLKNLLEKCKKEWEQAEIKANGVLLRNTEFEKGIEFCTNDLKELEKELREFDFKAWFEKEKLNILQRFHLHSQDGLTPNEVLTYFVEKEILGE